MGLVALIAAACATGLLISQVEGGLYPAVCLMGISVGFVVGMVIAYRLSSNKQKMLQQIFENFKNEKVPLLQFLPALEKSDEVTIRSVVDKLPERKELITSIIEHYKQVEKPTQEQLLLVSILKYGLADIPLLSEAEKAALPQFLADYEHKIFTLLHDPEELHPQLMARIYYLSQHPEWVKKNSEIAQRYLNLYVNIGRDLDIFLDKLMNLYPTLLMSYSIQYQNTTVKIPIFRMIALSPVFVDMFAELGNVMDPDTVIPIDGAYKCSPETVPLFLDYLKYGKICHLPPIEHAKLAQYYQLDHFASMCELSKADFKPTLKIAIQEELYDIQWMGLNAIMGNVKEAPALMEVNAKQFNQFIGHAMGLERSGPTLRYVPGIKKIKESPQFGKYFSTIPARRIWKINHPLSLEQLYWLKEHTDCEWDAITSTRALEQCHLCLQKSNTFLAGIFLKCAEKLLQNPETETPFGYNLETLSSIEGLVPLPFAPCADVESEVFSSIESMLSLYNFAQQKHAQDVVKAILKTLQAKEKGKGNH